MITDKGYANDSTRQPFLYSVECAHLVLTATRQHRDEIVAQVPYAIRHLAGARLAGERSATRRGAGPLPGRAGAKLARVVKQRRGYLKPLAPGLFDVADPMGGTKQDYRAAAVQIEKGIETILDVLLAPAFDTHLFERERRGAGTS